jgi:hypothetical protein
MTLVMTMGTSPWGLAVIEMYIVQEIALALKMCQGKHAHCGQSRWEHSAILQSSSYTIQFHIISLSTSTVIHLCQLYGSPLPYRTTQNHRDSRAKQLPLKPPKTYMPSAGELHTAEWCSRGDGGEPTGKSCCHRLASELRRSSWRLWLSHVTCCHVPFWSTSCEGEFLHFFLFHIFRRCSCAGMTPGGRRSADRSCAQCLCNSLRIPDVSFQQWYHSGTFWPSFCIIAIIIHTIDTIDTIATHRFWGRGRSESWNLW